MGVDAAALIVAIGALVVAGYGIQRQNLYAAREDKRRADEVAAQPADVRAELGELSLGTYFHVYEADLDTITGSEDSETSLAAVFRNRGGSPISIDRVEHLTITDLPIGPTEMLQRVSDSGPALPAVLQPNAGNSARYSTPLSGIAKQQPYIPVVDGGRVRYGFRAVLSDGTEVVSPMVTLRPPAPQPPDEADPTA